MASEAGRGEEQAATLELHDGTTRVPVFVTVRRADGITTGYLRLAYGHGSSVNRLLGSVGAMGRLILDEGTRPVRITSSDPGEAPGYLCAFSFCGHPPAHPADQPVGE
jgi:hypothetical protein